MSEIDREHQELVQGFVEEARELIDEAEPLIIELERWAGSTEADTETLNTIFRLFHSLKGGAGFLDMPLISRVTHEAETLLDIFRKGQAPVQAGHIDLINQTTDFLRSLLDQVATEFTDSGREKESEAVAAALRQAIESIHDDVPVPDATAAVEEQPAPSLDFSLPDDSGDGTDDLGVPITEEILTQFATESAEQLQAAEEALMHLEKGEHTEEAVQEAFRALHSFKGNCGFVGMRDMQELSNASETVLDMIRSDKLEPSSTVIGLLLEILDFLQAGLKQVREGGSGSIPATAGLRHLLEDAVSRQLNGGRPLSASGDPDAAEVEQADDSSNGQLVSNAAKEQAAASAAAQPRQSVRVDVEKMDRLLDLVGELVIAEAMVVQNPDLQGLDINLDSFERAVMQLNKITRELQDISTAIRMIPLSGTFRRMYRLVRDVSKRSGKQVDLVLDGESTEVDKTVIEHIADPLVHLLRNSIDHGIETPEERVKAGKDETGTVSIRAYYVGSEVWITVKDDGRGLNREKILDRALERGLVKAEDADTMSDEEVWPLIFQPGFSTAEKVTDVSGRGVGMDVVKRNLETIRGKVEVHSRKGEGSEVTLRIPLTLAIIDGMLLRVGLQKYVLPIVAIRESLQVKPGMTTRPMKGREVIRVRDELIPVIRLHDLFSVNTDVSELEEGIVTVLEVDGKPFGLFVDELLGQDQIVIKGLSNYVSDHPCISGCTIMGDGGICLILDVGGIYKLAGRTLKEVQRMKAQQPVSDFQSPSDE